MMIQQFYCLFYIFLFSSFVFSSSFDIISDINIQKSISIPPGSYYGFQFINFPLEDFYYLFYTRHISIETYENFEYDIYISSDKFPLTQIKSSNLLSKYPNVQRIYCTYNFFGRSFQNQCDFQLNFYGEPEYGWMPRFEDYFSGNIKKTYMSINVPIDSDCYMPMFSIRVSIQDRFTQGICMIILGLLLYYSSSYTLNSTFGYLFCWSIIGALFSIMSIFGIIIYLGCNKILKDRLTMSQLLFTVSIGWASMYYIDIIPSSYDFLNSSFWLSCTGIGALIGLIYGHTTKVTQEKKGRIAIALKILGLGLIFQSTYQLEFSIILCLLIVSEIPSKLFRIIFSYLFPSRKQQVKTNNFSKFDSKTQLYRDNPYLLATLSPKSRRNYLKKLNDPHLSVTYEMYDISNNSDSDLSDDDNEYDL